MTDETSPSSHPSSLTCRGTGSSSSSLSSSSAGTPSSSRATGTLRTFSHTSQYCCPVLPCSIRWLTVRLIHCAIACSLSVIIFPIVYFGWKITKRTRWIRLNEVGSRIQPLFSVEEFETDRDAYLLQMDFMTGRRELDEIDAFEQERAATKTGPWNKFLSILF